MLKILALFLFALTCLGCAPEMTEIAISPEFSDEQIEMFVDAAETWFEAVPEARLPLVISEDRGNGAVVIGKPNRCVRKQESGYTELIPGKVPVIHICRNMIWTDEQFRAAAMHELGHALARRTKHLSKGNLMEEGIDDVPPEPTGADRRYVASRYED